MEAVHEVTVAIQEVLATPKAQAASLSVSELKLMATDIAIAHGRNVNRFLNTIGCESGWDVYAKGDYTVDGVHFFPEKFAPAGAVPTSFGLAQLHYPSKDWGISTTTAYEPATALEMMALSWERGEQHRWSCYK